MGDGRLRRWQLRLPGQYKAAVNFNTNDSLHRTLPVNVTMNVVASALWGQLQGNVEATERCATWTRILC